MRDLLPQPEITSQLLEGVEFHPKTERMPDLVRFSEEQQVMGLIEPQAVLGYTAMEPDAEGKFPQVIAINSRQAAEVTISDRHGIQLFNTQEALAASLNPRHHGGPLVRALYACELRNEDVLHATPYSRMGWIRDSLRRNPNYPDGTRIHSPTIGTLLRYQANQLRALRAPQTTEEGSEQVPNIVVPPRRITVFTGRLTCMGIVPDTEPEPPVSEESQE